MKQKKIFFGKKEFIYFVGKSDLQTEGEAE